jgi:hypothetical protein
MASRHFSQGGWKIQGQVNVLALIGASWHVIPHLPGFQVLTSHMDDVGLAKLNILKWILTEGY